MKSLVLGLFLMQSALVQALLFANDSGEKITGEFLPIPEDITPSQREVVIPALGDSKLEKLLSRYYSEGLGGVSAWEGINSLRVQGTILLDGESFKIQVFQRKPNLLKMVLSKREMVMVVGYDGKDAWSYFPNANTKGTLLEESEARNLVHASIFGNYLLYPYRSNKTLQYLGTKADGNTICHIIRVALDSQFLVDYFIDVRNYLESRIVNKDLTNGSVTSIIVEDYRIVDGVPFAHRIKNYKDDLLISDLTIEKIDLNLGLTAWFFNTPNQ
jgi:hypothetical protein